VPAPPPELGVELPELALVVFDDELAEAAGLADARESVR